MVTYPGPGEALQMGHGARSSWSHQFENYGGAFELQKERCSDCPVRNCRIRLFVPARTLAEQKSLLALQGEGWVCDSIDIHGLAFSSNLGSGYEFAFE